MTGWKSKKMLRDVDLVDVIIDLTKKLEEAERQRDNALAVVMQLRKLLDEKTNKI